MGGNRLTWDMPISGGTATTTATSGFVVNDLTAGGRGVTTAGHFGECRSQTASTCAAAFTVSSTCRSNGTARDNRHGVDLAFVRQAYARSQDVELRKPGSTHTLTNRIRSQGYDYTVTAKLNVRLWNEGTFIYCKEGTSTGHTCGTVVSNYASFSAGMGGTFVRGTTNDPTKGMAIGGDSGGPAYSGVSGQPSQLTAVGVTVGARGWSDDRPNLWRSPGRSLLHDDPRCRKCPQRQHRALVMRGRPHRLFPRIAAGAVFVSLASCVSQGRAGEPVTDSAVVDYQARALAWSEVIRRASRVEGYGGFDRTAEKLYVGFTADPVGKLAQITDRTDVAPFTARYSYAQMQAQLAAAGRAFAALNVPYAALAADYRRGAIVVTDVENAAKRGPYRCHQLMPMQRNLAGVSVPLIDQRACSD